MSRYFTHAELAEFARQRIARRAEYRSRYHYGTSHGRREARALPMSPRFWADLELMHLKVQYMAARRAEYRMENKW